MKGERLVLLDSIVKTTALQEYDGARDADARTMTPPTITLP